MEEKKSKKVLSLLLILILVFVIRFGISLINTHVLNKISLTVRPLLQFLCCLVLLPLPIVSMRKRKETFKDLGLEKDKILIQIISGVTISIIMSLVLIVVPAFFSNGRSASNSNVSILYYMFSFIYSVFGVALTEEFIFRGFLYNRLQTLFGSLPLTIVVTSILCGLFHFLSGNVYQAIISAIIGAFFCFCKEGIRSCSLLSLVVAHGIYEFLSLNRSLILQLLNK